MTPGEAPTIGARVRQARTARGLSQRELERQCQMHHPDVRDIEEGKIDPKFSVMIRIASVLNFCLGPCPHVRGGVQAPTPEESPP